MTTFATTPPTRDDDALPVLELRGERSSVTGLGRDLWTARELLVLLARKEFQVKYRRMSFGTLWAVVLPLMQSVVMAVVFSHLLSRFKIPHYPLFVLSGMAAFSYFTTVLAGGSTAIAANATLSNKVYFPRAVLCLAQAVTALYGLVILLAIMLVLSVPLGVHVGLALLLLIPGVALLVLFSASLTLTAAALHVYFRDVSYIVNALVIFLMYISPVIYPPSLAPSVVRPILLANPLTGILDVFHAAVGVPTPLVQGLAVTGIWTVVFAAAAVVLHTRYDRVFTDLL
jgi:ABC-type polysaccharide/polyol phosphate export permease